MAALAYKMFALQHEYLENILHTKWMYPDSKLALIGGIQINVDGDSTNHRFLPLLFEVRGKDFSHDVYKEVLKMESTYKGI